MDFSSKRLAGKRILVGVTGGVALYKTLDVIGRLHDEGAETRVIMTESATKLVQPLLFQARSGYAVVTDLWRPAQANVIEHVSYARWADLLLVAPLTANTMAKLAHGIADDALTTLHLAYDGPTLVAPAMNTVMLRHSATQQNLKTLAERGVEIIDPVFGMLACGDEGDGKMASVEEIVEATVLALTRSEELTGKRVLVTAGPTREHVDPVRFLSNPSSGKMGYALASEAARRGADVTLISGPTALSAPRNVARRGVTTALEMSDAVSAECDAADILIFCAAVADYRPAQRADEKTKKAAGARTLELTLNPDIALETAARAKPGQVRVGFAAETRNIKAEALRKLKLKNFDFIVGNDVSDPEIGFESDANRVVLIDAKGEATPIDTMAKTALARRLFDAFVPALKEK